MRHDKKSTARIDVGITYEEPYGRITRLFRISPKALAKIIRKAEAHERREDKAQKHMMQNVYRSIRCFLGGSHEYAPFMGNADYVNRMRLHQILQDTDEMPVLQDRAGNRWRPVRENTVQEIRYFIEQLLREGENANADCGGPENGTGGEREADAAGTGTGLGTDL